MIGSGEVILTTRVGAILGTDVLWAIILGIFLKYVIGLGGARYTVCTGEGMIDMQVVMLLAIGTESDDLVLSIQIGYRWQEIKLIHLNSTM